MFQKSASIPVISCGPGMMVIQQHTPSHPQCSHTPYAVRFLALRRVRRYLLYVFHLIVLCVQAGINVLVEYELCPAKKKTICPTFVKYVRIVNLVKQWVYIQEA